MNMQTRTVAELIAASTGEGTESLDLVVCERLPFNLETCLHPGKTEISLTVFKS